MNNKEYTSVRAIENGTVIDHLPPASVFKVMRLLNIEHTLSPVIFGMNLDSKRMGKKSLIKIVDKYCDEGTLNYLALVAPSARVSIIRNYEVIDKRQIEAPQTVTGYVRCANPTCITNHEKIITRFDVIQQNGELSLKCRYCEKITQQEQIQIFK